MIYKSGDKIKFASEKKPYKVMACDSRYLICVKPFNLKNTYLYCIVDLERKERGPENLIFGHDYNLFDKEDCELLLKDFQTGTLRLSLRRLVPLDIET